MALNIGKKITEKSEEGIFLTISHLDRLKTEIESSAEPSELIVSLESYLTKFIEQIGNVELVARAIVICNRLSHSSYSKISSMDFISLYTTTNRFQKLESLSEVIKILRSRAENDYTQLQATLKISKKDISILAINNALSEAFEYMNLLDELGSLIPQIEQEYQINYTSEDIKFISESFPIIQDEHILHDLSSITGVIDIQNLSFVIKSKIAQNNYSNVSITQYNLTQELEKLVLGVHYFYQSDTDGNKRIFITKQGLISLTGNKFLISNELQTYLVDIDNPFALVDTERLVNNTVSQFRNLKEFIRDYYGIDISIDEILNVIRKNFKEYRDYFIYFNGKANSIRLSQNVFSKISDLQGLRKLVNDFMKSGENLRKEDIIFILEYFLLDQDPEDLELSDYFQEEKETVETIKLQITDIESEIKNIAESLNHIENIDIILRRVAVPEDSITKYINDNLAETHPEIFRNRYFEIIVSQALKFAYEKNIPIDPESYKQVIYKITELVVKFAEYFDIIEPEDLNKLKIIDVKRKFTSITNLDVLLNNLGIENPIIIFFVKYTFELTLKARTDNALQSYFSFYKEGFINYLTNFIKTEESEASEIDDLGSTIINSIENKVDLNEDLINRLASLKNNSTQFEQFVTSLAIKFQNKLEQNGTLQKDSDLILIENNLAEDAKSLTLTMYKQIARELCRYLLKEIQTTGHVAYSRFTSAAKKLITAKAVRENLTILEGSAYKAHIGGRTGFRIHICKSINQNKETEYIMCLTKHWHDKDDV